MNDYNVFYAIKIKLKDKNRIEDLHKHLLMNNYTFGISCNNTIFIYSEELFYVETILKDNNIKYEIM